MVIKERTFAFLKPDAYHRFRVGDIIGYFERRRLTILELKLVRPTRALLEQQYPPSEAWLVTIGDRTVTELKESGYEPRKIYKTDSPMEIGKRLRHQMIDTMVGQPCIALILGGWNAMKVVRKIVGPTSPAEAPPGTIRGDFSSESQLTANAYNRPLLNLIHASSSLEDAEREMKLWFPEFGRAILSKKRKRKKKPKPKTKKRRG